MICDCRWPSQGSVLCKSARHCATIIVTGCSNERYTSWQNQHAGLNNIEQQKAPLMIVQSAAGLLDSQQANML